MTTAAEPPDDPTLSNHSTLRNEDDPRSMLEMPTPIEATRSADSCGALLRSASSSRTGKSASQDVVSEDIALQVEILGARGSMPIAGPAYAGYGGETSCVAIRAGSRIVVLDAGTGIVTLGRELATRGVSDIDLFLSHLHYDHIVGLPFFLSMLDPATRLRIHLGGATDDATARAAVADYFRQPFFPVSLDCFPAEVSIHALAIGECLEIETGGEPLKVTAGALNHPGGATGFRVTRAERSFAYLTDFEHDGGEGDDSLIELAKGVDLALLDATFTPEEHSDCCGWGHAHWRAATDLALRAGIERFGLFHHKHDREDEGLDAIGRELAALAPNGFVARTAQRFDLERP